MAEETKEEKDTVKTPPAKGKKKPERKPAPANMIYRLGDVLRNTPGFEKLPKIRHNKNTYGKQKDN